MTQILVDVHRIEGARSGIRILGDSAVVDVYYQGLFEKYGITKAQYDTSFVYYGHFPKQMMEMYDIVIDSLNLQKIQIEKAGKKQD